MTTVRLSWRRAAEVAAAAVGAAWLVTAPLVVGIWAVIDAAAGDSAIGYAFVAIVVGVPASTGVYLLGGGLVLHAVVARCGILLGFWLGVALLGVAGLAGLLVTPAAALLGDGSAAVAAVDLLGTLAAAVPLVRWLARAPAASGVPDPAW